MSELPLQPLALDEDGVMRFQANAIVRYLLDAGPFGMNDLANIPFSVEDQEQFAQLIGYSLCGFRELSYVRDETYEAAHGVACAKGTAMPKPHRKSFNPLSWLFWGCLVLALFYWGYHDITAWCDWPRPTRVLNE
jgi:hypothetical protein